MFYYRKFEPIAGDIVFAKIMALDALGIKIKLVEYDDKEGYILYNNLLKRKKKDINHTYKVNKDIIVEYTDVFEGLWSFTDKNLDQEKIKEYEINFKKYQKIINIINMFLKQNPDVDSKSLFENVLYNVKPSTEIIEADEDEDDEDYNPFDILQVYDKIIKDDIINFELDAELKDKYFVFLKKMITDSKFKGVVKYDSFSPNSSGLFEIKNFYLDVIRFAKENEININIKLEAVPTYVIFFDDERYNDKMKEKVSKIIDYISSQKIKFSNKLVSNTITEY